MIGLSHDFTEYVKEYVPQGQKISLWENFLTGLQSEYSTAGQQVSEQAAYDISGAYANYKQQQLQLQMNQQLGAGFKEQVGSELQSAYESAFSDIKAQEASDLRTVVSEYAKTYESGEQQFEKLGKLAQQYHTLLDDYADSLGGIAEKPSVLYEKVGTDEQGQDIYEMTDAARLWYYDVSKGLGEQGGFDQWVVSDDALTDISLEDREQILTALRENPDLFKSAIGIGSDFDPEATRTAIQNQKLKEQQEALKARVDNIVSYKMNSHKDILHTYNDYTVGDTKQLNAISNDVSDFTKAHTSMSAVVSVQSTYNKQRSRYHTTVKLKDSDLTPQQRNAIRSEIGSMADNYLKNGVWTIKLSDDGKIGAGEFGMSYSEYARVIKRSE